MPQRKRFPFVGRHQIRLRSPSGRSSLDAMDSDYAAPPSGSELNKSRKFLLYDRRADRRDRGGLETETFGTEVRYWNSRYTVRRGGFEFINDTGVKQSLESTGVGWDMVDENKVHCKIVQIRLVPENTPLFIQLFVERIIS